MAVKPLLKMNSILHQPRADVFNVGFANASSIPSRTQRFRYIKVSLIGMLGFSSYTFLTMSCCGEQAPPYHSVSLSAFQF